MKIDWVLVFGITYALVGIYFMFIWQPSKKWVDDELKRQKKNK